MFQTLSYIGILISELAQRTARRGSRNATKRRSKITYSVMTLAAKPTHNNQKRRANRTFAERFTLIVKYRSASHASTRIIPTITHTCSECPLLRMSSGRAAQLTCAQPLAPVLRATSTYYATLRTAARYTGIRLQRAAPPPRKWRVIFACHVNQFFCLATSAPQKMPFAAYFCAAPIIAIMLQV